MNDSNSSKLSEMPIRIKQIRSVFCMGDNGEFAKKLGKSKQYVSSLCNGNESTGKKITEEILAAFPQVNRVWLMLGEGDMLIKDDEREKKSDNQINMCSTSGHTMNAIGDHNKQTISFSDATKTILKMYEDRLQDKNETITTLKDTITALQGEVEQLRAYVKLTSTKYIEEIERMRIITADTHDLVKQTTDRIGFKSCKEE